MKFLKNLEKFVVLSLILLGFSSLISFIIKYTPYIFSLNSQLSSYISVSLSITIVLLATLLFLFYFWKKWDNHLLIVFVGLLNLIFNLLFYSVNLLPFPFNVIAFQFFFLLLPVILLLPFVGPMALVYAYLRGFLKKEVVKEVDNGLVLPQNSEIIDVQNNITYWKNIIATVLGIIILGIIAYPFYYIFIFSGTTENVLTQDTEESIKNDPNIGKIITLNTPVAYIVDSLADGNTPKVNEINRSLNCINHYDFIGEHNYKDGYYKVTYVKSDMKFEIVDVISIRHQGLDRMGGPGYDLAVLKDENGILSHELLDFINGKYRDNGEYDCVGRMDSHIDKLFRYAEKTGKTRVLITVYDQKNQEISDSAQDRYLQWLQKIPSMYKVSNVVKMKNPITGNPGIAFDTDMNTLVYLVANPYGDLKDPMRVNVWNIFGLDKEYQTMLTEDELQYIKKEPIKNARKSLDAQIPKSTSTPDIKISLDFSSVSCKNKLYSTNGFEFMNPCWYLQENTDPNYGYKSYYISKRVNGSNNYLNFIASSNYEYDPVPGNPTTSKEKIAGKNSIVKSWESNGMKFKRYYITDQVTGWVKCSDSLTNSLSCGKIEYFSTTDNELLEIQKMIESIKFK